MINRLITRSEEGNAAVETALALPILITFIYGLFQMGLVFQANAGIQHALGEAARDATIHPVPTDVQLAEMIEDKRFGTYNGTLTGTTIVTNTNADGDPDGTRTMTLTYSQPTDFIFFQGPTVQLSKSKTYYTAITSGAAGTTSCAFDEDGDMACTTS